MSEASKTSDAPKTSVAPKTSMELIEETFRPLDGRHILDIGCGAGGLARALTKRGARVTGVDPDRARIEAARTAAPSAAFEAIGAGVMPFADAAFDGAVFLNSLHHVPTSEMDAALAEAARVVGPGRTVVVVEPRAEGSFFRAFLPIEDETLVRADAQAALARALAAGLFETIADETYGRPEIYDSLDAFLAGTVGQDAERLATVASRRREIESTFEAEAKRLPDGRYAFDQPMHGMVLRVR